MLLLVFATALVVASCTDLSESINNEVPAEEFFNNEEEFVSALGDAYSPFTAYGNSGGLPALYEVTSDEAVVPQIGPDWEDGGVWLRLHRHTWTTDDPAIDGGWNTLFSGVNNANRLIFQFETVVEEGNADPELAETFIAELRAVRAFSYYMLLDAFGNVPIITSFEDVAEEPFQPSENFEEGRKAVFDFVESELLDVVNKVDTDVGGTIGRMNKWVVHTILTRLYLNAEVYTGTPRWEEAVDHANQVINSGNYSLMDNYSATFAIDNTGSPAHIFVVPYDNVFLSGFNHMHMTHHIGGGQEAFNMAVQPWGGFKATKDYYASFIDPEQNPGPQGTVVGLDELGTETTGTLDDRLSNFLVGPLLNPQGEQVNDAGVEGFDPDGPPITHTPHINELAPLALRQAGARIVKYEPEVGISGTNMKNDFVVMRYAHILLDKAEALWRMDPGSNEALMLINEIRQRAGVDPFESLDADKLLAERGRETFYDIIRRQDQIRFAGDESETDFNDPWTFKEESSITRNVFPIPRDQLNTNSNLVQNPGY
ncbi:MAG: RagB/SusD family nutrient uptake outer membrane protein [Balneolaceae bacterium]|nr:RagB/SusD family nutrient uptake outer membrane protein [Balneolaceae bacterium]